MRESERESKDRHGEAEKMGVREKRSGGGVEREKERQREGQ